MTITGVTHDLIKIGRSLAPIVGTAAPLLASVLGSPMAGVGISLLCKLFGISTDNAETLTGILQSDSTKLDQVKTLDIEYKELLAQCNSTDYRTEVDDRENARSREIVLKDRTLPIMAFGFLAIYTIVQLYCVIHEGQGLDVISARVQDILVMIISYYFGSSHKRDSKPDG